MAATEIEDDPWMIVDVGEEEEEEEEEAMEHSIYSIEIWVGLNVTRSSSRRASGRRVDEDYGREADGGRATVQKRRRRRRERGRERRRRFAEETKVFTDTDDWRYVGQRSDVSSA